MVSISALKECLSVNSSENAFMSAFMLGTFPLDHNHIFLLTGQSIANSEICCDS